MAGKPFEPIEIVGVDKPNVGVPRDDGTRGSGLYRVPVKLSRRPPREWAADLPKAWDRPPRYGGGGIDQQGHTDMMSGRDTALLLSRGSSTRGSQLPWPQ